MPRQVSTDDRLAESLLRTRDWCISRVSTASTTFCAVSAWYESSFRYLMSDADSWKTRITGRGWAVPWWVALSTTSSMRGLIRDSLTNSLVLEGVSVYVDREVGMGGQTQS